MNSDFKAESLNEAQAQTKLKQIGLNELPQSKKENFWEYFSKLVKEPMLLLLLVAGAIYLVMGDFGEGIMLGISIFFVIGISVYQERKSKKALDALRDLSSPRALVIRDGVEKRLSAGQIVPGDLIVLHEGDRVPADGYILESMNLNVDESLLTGESFPVKKKSLLKEISSEAYESTKSEYKVFSSTLVISGLAYVRVQKTGVNTEVGKIGMSLQELEPEELNLTREIRQIVRLFAWSGSIFCLVIILLYGFKHGQWLQAFLVGLATQMSLLPEEFPVMLTIFLAMGAWRLSKVQVLIRRPGAIERLGAITVLCVDKTGTLTKNRMAVASLNNTLQTIEINPDSTEELKESFHEVAEYAVLASHLDPFDPMEKAILGMVKRGTWGRDHIHKDWIFISDYPLSDKLLAMSCVWKNPNFSSYIIAAKGAPEAIVDLCHLDAVESERVMNATKQMALKGLRVLGVAKANFEMKTLPKDPHEFKFQWIGLIGLEDPLRAEVPEAVQKCRDAGVRVIMMTGDHPETALNIGERAGIDTENALITGSEVNLLNDESLQERLKKAHIFARMVPDQKLRIVKLLKGLGHVVAMTGDGVNDAPSLKWADVGIAMGSRGTDVAREASDIVLLDDNFSSIVSGIERGRLIFSNIKKAMGYIVSIHVPIAGLSIFPVLFNAPLILMPIHIVFLELVIDPACSLLFESQTVSGGDMKRPPRALNTRLFNIRDLLKSFLQGGIVLGIVGLVLWYETNIGNESVERARTFAYIVLAMCNLGLIFANIGGGSFRQLKLAFKNKNNLLIILGVVACLLVITQLEEVSAFFYFSSLTVREFAISILVALVVFQVIHSWNWLVKK